MLQKQEIPTKTNVTKEGLTTTTPTTKNVTKQEIPTKTNVTKEGLTTTTPTTKNRYKTRNYQQSN